MTKTGRIYLIRCPAGVGRYVGSTESPGRMHGHRSSCKADPLSCPLYRYATENHGDLSDFTEETVATLALPDNDREAKTLLRSLEGLVIRALRNDPTVNLLNKNNPIAENRRNRDRQRAWRLQHGQGQVDENGRSMSYMAVASRRYRQQRRERMEAARAAQAAQAVNEPE